MLHPKSLNVENWKKLTKKFKKLDLNSWNYLDGIKKFNMLRLAKIGINTIPIFGNEFIVNYPEDIYLFDAADKFIFDVVTLNKMRKIALYEEKEIGGTIEYYEKNPKIDIKFSGDENRIHLDFTKDTHSMFHTHPEDSDRKFDPPSILDILSHLALIIKFLADVIIDLENGVEHPSDEPLIVQNSIVFAKDELYVYYISKQLVYKINDKLMQLYRENENFVESVEKLLEEMELKYSGYLFFFNRDLDQQSLNDYISVLNSLGIIIKRFSYLENPEAYIVL